VQNDSPVYSEERYDSEDKYPTILSQLQVMALLRPLLLDNVASIQQSAALALGRLANYSDELAESVVTHEILPQLV
jgi:hypothetical protein